MLKAGLRHFPSQPPLTHLRPASTLSSHSWLLAAPLVRPPTPDSMGGARMTAWRSLGIGVLALVTVQPAWSQTVTLAENLQAGDCFRLRLEMTLSGEIRVHKGDKPVAMKRTATATHEFPERILAVGASHMPTRVVRAYETARAAIGLDGQSSERTLRPERRLIVVERTKNQVLAYCPTGPLTREELELTGEQFDTLALTGLLPAKEVSVGATWKLSNEVVQSLCGFEGLTGQELRCKLEEVKNNVARITATGTATGIDLGALAKLKIDASCLFDLNCHRIVALEWKQQDERDQGPASPATTVQTTTTLRRTPIEQPPSLNEVALVSVPAGEPPPQMTQLTHHEAKDRYDLAYSRDWQMVAQTDDHVVMRLLDQGDFIAQVTITPWTRARPGEHLTADAFQKAMASTPGWEQADILQASEVPAEAGRWVYRISALGKMDGMKLLQNFYLVAGPYGEQVVLAFTMTQARAEKLGSRDLSLVGSLDFPPIRQK